MKRQIVENHWERGFLEIFVTARGHIGLVFNNRSILHSKNFFQSRLFTLGRFISGKCTMTLHCWQGGFPGIEISPQWSVRGRDE